MNHNLLQSGVARLSGRKSGHPNRPATPFNFRTTIIGDISMKKMDISTPKHPNTFALVDDEDFEHLSQWKWHLNTWGYATSTKGDNKTRWMHRVILNVPKGVEVDHINHDKLDNRRCNIRPCSRAENARNHPLKRNNTSGFKGVYWNKVRKKWHSRIKVDGKYISLGYYFCIVKAAVVYDDAAKKYHRKFSYLNFQ